MCVTAIFPSPCLMFISCTVAHYPKRWGCEAGLLFLKRHAGRNNSWYLGKDNKQKEVQLKDNYYFCPFKTKKSKYWFSRYYAAANLPWSYVMVLWLRWKCSFEKGHFLFLYCRSILVTAGHICLSFRKRLSRTAETIYNYLTVYLLSRRPVNQVSCWRGPLLPLQDYRATLWGSN